jgi:cytochrome c
MKRLAVFILSLASWNAFADASDQTLLQACSSCHAVRESDQQGIGPSLVNIVNRPAGSLPNYVYSEALADAGFTWSTGTLRVWIQHSEAMLPGTFMRYNNGLTEAEIERLLTLLSEPTPTPH